MKKSLLALAVLGAFAGVAQAQTSVTIYGSFDAGVRNQRDVDAAGRSRTTMSSTGTYNSNRLGFKGVEDLGGGLNAHFTLESGFNSGTGALNNNDNRLFQRSAFVGLGGQWGSLDLGRQYTVAFKTVGAYDPFNYKFTGIIPLTAASVSAGTRNDNDIQYTGTFGPITARAEYALGERAGGGSGNTAAAVGATYANGPFSVGGAYTKRNPNLATAAQTTAGVTNFQDNTHWTVGGAFTFGPARIAAGYANETQDRANGRGEADQKNAWIGGSYDITPALGLTAAYYHTKVDAGAFGTTNTAAGKRGLFIIGATYALSKRTNFYADIDYAKYKDGLVTPSTGSNVITSQSSLISAPGQDTMLGFSVGINHLF